MRLLLSLIAFLSLCSFLLFNPTFAAQPDPTPRLRLEPSMHFAMINRVAIDKAERFVVTASDDKTSRVWDARDGRLLSTLRIPIGNGNEGKLYSVAISPNGQWVVAAGWTGYEWQRKTDVYVFNRQNGELLTRLRNLPEVINDLAFSPDGRYLAVALGGRNGIRLYQVHNWQEIGRDTDYVGSSYSVNFNERGGLVSSCEDGYLRLYSAQGKLSLLHKEASQEGRDPFFVRFSPNGQEIVVGFDDSTNVEIRSAKDLSFIRKTNTHHINNGDLSKVAWSRQGRYLYAAGVYDNGRGNPIVRWQQGGLGASNEIAASQTTVQGILPLGDGGLIYASADPTLSRLNAAGQVVWKNAAGKLDYSGYQALRDFSLSPDGMAVQFRYKQEARNGSVKQGYTSWGMEEQALGAQQSWNKPRITAQGLQITAWEDTREPKLNGKALALRSFEMSRSLAISPNAQQFALGTGWYVRLFNRNGTQRWEKPVPVAWAVNISADNRWVVAALGDGTIRWYALNDGKEHLAFYLHTDEKRWVAWTPEGFYAASPGAEELIGYHLNNGADKAAEFVKVDRLREVYDRPDLVTKALDAEYPSLAQATLKRFGNVRNLLRADRLPPRIQLVSKSYQTVQRAEFPIDLMLHDQGNGFGRLEYRVNGKVVSDASVRGAGAHAPGGVKRAKRSFTLPNGQSVIEVVAYGKHDKVASAPVKVTVNVRDPVQQRPSLYVLSLGVTDYLDDSFDLKYAASDAQIFADTLVDHTGDALYRHIEKKVLVDQQVTLHGIQQAINDMSKRVKAQDVFVLYLAGHGMSLDGSYHFIPQNLRYTNNNATRQQALSADKLRDWLSVVKAQKNLLVLDTCNAGRSIKTLAMARGGNSIEDKVAISNLMESTGFMVLAASSSAQQAFAGIVDHNTGQGHGLFTNSVLNGIRGAADRNGNRQVSIRELENYVQGQVPRLSQQKWGFKQIPMSYVEGSDFPVALRQ